MDTVKYNIPHFIMGILFWVLVVAAIAYISWLWNTINQWHIERMEILEKLDKISIKIDNNTCNLPNWVQDKIEQIYNNITSATCVNP